MGRHLRIFALYFQHAFQHRARNFVWFLIAFINPLVLLLFWQGILSGDQKLQGWDINSMRTYYLFLIMAQAALMHHVELTVGFNDIKQGELMRELLKPYSYFAMRLIAETPWRALQTSYAVITVLMVSYLLKAPIEVSHDLRIIFLAVLIAANAFFISFLFKMIVGFTAFWMTNIDSVLEVNDVLLFGLSGLVMPINLFPQWMQTLAHFTPYPYILYYPISAFIGVHNSAELFNIMLQQFGWIAGLLILISVMWNRGLKKFSGIGQ